MTAPFYLDRFPDDARPHAERAYQDGFSDGAGHGGTLADAIRAALDDRAGPAANQLAAIRQAVADYEGEEESDDLARRVAGLRADGLYIIPDGAPGLPRWKVTQATGEGVAVCVGYAESEAAAVDLAEATPL